MRLFLTLLGGSALFLILLFLTGSIDLNIERQADTVPPEVPPGQSSAPEETEEETSLSELYINEGLGFEINHPPAWSVDEFEQAVSLTDESGSGAVTVIVNPAPEGATLAGIAALSRAQFEEQFNTAIPPPESLNINGRQSLGFVFNFTANERGFSGLFYSLMAGDRVYGIMGVVNSDAARLASVNAMALTFKVLD